MTEPRELTNQDARRARKKSGVSIGELAAKLHYSQQHLYRIEAGTIHKGIVTRVPFGFRDKLKEGLIACLKKQQQAIDRKIQSLQDESIFSELEDEHGSTG